MGNIMLGAPSTLVTTKPINGVPSCLLIFTDKNHWVIIIKRNYITLPFTGQEEQGELAHTYWTADWED
jgi:hypothetical protein